MVQLYNRIFLLLLIFTVTALTEQAYAQKNLKLRILSVNYTQTSGTDCDGGFCLDGNGRVDIAFDVDDGGNDVNETCHEGSNNTTNYTWNANFDPFDANYDFVCQWPSGNLNFIVEAWDRDQSACITEQCIGGGFANVFSDGLCSVNITAAYPASSLVGPGPTQTASCTFNGGYDGDGNCGGTITVQYRWEAANSFKSQSTFDYICGAIDKGTLNTGATLSHSNFSNSSATSEDLCASNEPNVSSSDETVWFKFTTGATPGTVVTVDASAIGGSGSGGACVFGEIVAAWTKVYEGPATIPGCPFPYTSNPFSGLLTEVGSSGIDVSDVDVNCPKPNQAYYVQIDMGGLATCDVGSFNLTIRDNGKVAGPNLICNATDLGTAPYGGPLSNTTNTDLFINNQSNQCANVGAGEPDQMTGSLNRTTWYKFKTPTVTSGGLPHTYQVMVTKDGGSPIDAFPAFTLWKDLTGTGTRTCESFANLQYVSDDYGLDITNSDANVDRQCLDPNSWYYIQIDHASILGDFINYSVRVKKDAFKPGDNICDATDLGYITSNGLANGTTTNVNWTLANKFTAAPYFGLPHTNKCSSAEPGEPQATPGGPNPNSGTHTATVWYKFTTGSNAPPDWIYWYNDDDVFGDGNRGTLCAFGTTFNSRVTFYKNITTFACPVGGNLQAQEEMNVPGDLCDATTGIGFGAPCYADMFRLKCPQPNTTYWVQVEDAGAISTCYEGQWTFDNSDNIISTAPTIGGAPINDTICGAIDLGTVPNTSGTTAAMANLYDNFCATADQQFRADFTQSLDRDVWFRFKPPLSGSVRITAQSAPTGSPSIDNDLDLQVAIWEPILGDGTNAHCSDPRFLWTPIVSQDHEVQEATEAGVITTSWYDIYNTCGNSALCNEGNSLIATCLDPNKYYYVQVDGGSYFACDLIDAGDCIMGYFKIQIQDAGLGLYNSAAPGDVGTPYTSLGVPNSTLKHDEPCFAQLLNTSGTWVNMTNRCATSINDPIPSQWQAHNSSTDKTVWARFVAPPSGKVKIRAENISQLKGDADYHDDINLQLALYGTTSNCFDKNSQFYETGGGNGFDGGAVEIDPLNADDYVSVCVPCVGTCGFDEYMVARCLVPGQTYYIMIDGDAGYTCLADVEDVEGDFRISVTEMNGIPASTNDSICQAYNMSGVGGLGVNGVYTTPIAFNNECASIDPSYEGPGKIAEEIEGMIADFDVEHTLWYRFVAPSSGKVKIEAIEDNGIDDIDLGIAIYDIPTQNCANIQSNGFAFDEDYDPAVFGIANSDDEEITVSCLVPGRTYWVQVDGNRNITTCGPAFSGTDCETGQFRVRVTHLPADPTYANSVTYSSPSTTSPGGNDMFCSAHQVVNIGGNYSSGNQNTFLNPGETINFHHNNRCATAEQNEPEANGWDLNPFDSDSDPTVWYTFNTGPTTGPTRPGEITIRITNPSGTCFDPDLDLYEYNGSFSTAACNGQVPNHFNPLLRVGEGQVFDIFKPREEEIKILCPRANTRYFLRVLGTSTCPLFGDDQGEFDISISMNNTLMNFQNNDDICGALDVGSGFLVSGTTLTLNNQNNNCATQQLGEPNTTQSAVQNEPEYDETMWYKFTTENDPGVVQVVCDHVNSSGIAAVPSITVYKYTPAPSTGTGTACSATPFYNIADVASNMGFAVAGVVTIDSAKVTLPCVSPNTTYFIQVDGADASLWGFAIPGFTDEFTYNIIVRDLGAGSGRAVNDNLANVIPLDNTFPVDGLLAAGGSLTINSHNRCATCEQNEPNADFCGTNATDHNDANEDETVWFHFTTPAKPGVITVTLQDDGTMPGTFSPNFTLYYNNGMSPSYRITGAPSQVLIQEGPNAFSLLGTASQSYTCLLPNTRYYVQVDGNDLVPTRTDQSDFILTVTDDGSGNPGPSNDLICSAENVAIPSNGTTGALPRTNKCSWEETGEPNTSSNMGGTGNDVTSDNYDETVWFTFVPPVDGDITLTLDPTSGLNGGINYRLYQKTGTGNISCSGSPADIPNWSQLTEIAQGTGGPFGVGDVITETFSCLSAGRRYYIQVDGNDLIASADVGNFNITLTHSTHASQVNDNICGIGATAATGNIGTFTTSAIVTATLQDNRCATQEVNEPNVNGNINDITDPNYDHTLWYRFVASNTDGSYNVTITNVGGDPINGSITVYRQDATVCPSTNFNGLTEIKESSVINSASNDESLLLECWEIEEGKTYYIQVQGWDGVGGGDVGNNFNVAVQFTSAATNAADNICTAPTVTIGSTVAADNRCATTQNGEPNISPSPQSPANGGDYDETLWYEFTAPASGEVQLNTSAYSSVLLSLTAELYSQPTGYNCAVNGFSGLVREDYTSTLTSVTNTWQGGLRCLIPGRKYFLRFDGNDIATDKGTWNFGLTDIFPSPSGVPSNDEPCGAIDVTQFVRTSPCTSDGQFYTNNYSVLDQAIDVDRATRTVTAIGCDGSYNCNDYWFKFTVPSDATGIRVQGNDEYPGPLNNSVENIGVYRAVNGCAGTLQQINCGSGGLGTDVDMTLAAFPGETLYLQVFNENAPTSPTSTGFGFCISVDCPAKTTCLANNLEYGQPQCWNMNTNGVNLSPQYYDCMPGSNNSVNYFSFSTDCDNTPHDTVTVVFSVTNIGCGQTAMSMFLDQTPCTAPLGQYDDILVNCAVFEEVFGGTTATNFMSTFILPRCATYVMQIISDENNVSCASAGQVLVFQSYLLPQTVLPVELVSFTGYNNGASNVLNWTTASELNSLKFEVEKSVDGVNFYYIGEKPAAGFSNQPLNYELIDNFPVAGNNYYRLKMIDTDQSFGYSDVINIRVDAVNSVTDAIINIYPNPTSGQLNIVYSASKEQRADLVVFNTIGQVVTKKVYTLAAGVNTLTLDAQDYAAGVYLLNILNTTTGNKYYSKFVKE